MPELYPQVNEETFWSQANASLIRYSGPFVPVVAVKAQGRFIELSDGRKLLDFTSGQMSSLLGHGHPEIVQVATEHIQHLDHLFSSMLSPPVVAAATKLTSLLPPGLDKAMFLSTGAESNEAALRMARLYTGKFEVVGLASAWHGMTNGASALTFFAGRKNYGPTAPGTLMLPTPDAYRSVFRKNDGEYDWEAELEYGWGMVDRQSVGSLAALIVEPILSSGGVIVPPPGYLKALKKHCEARGMLMILDEAQTGVGRTGKMWAFEHEDFVPDIITLSKTLGSGLPVAAVVTSTEIEQVCYDRGYLFYTTHVSDPLAAAIALKVLEIVERDELCTRAAKAGQLLLDGLRDLQNKFGCIGDIRGRGLMCGMDIVSDRERKTADEPLARKLAEKMLELGMNANVVNLPGSGAVFRLAPPLTVTDEEIELGLSIIDGALRALEGTQPL